MKRLIRLITARTAAESAAPKSNLSASVGCQMKATFSDADAVPDSSEACHAAY